MSDTSDATSNGLNLTNNNSVTFVSGLIGNAASIAGGSNQTLTATIPTGLKITTTTDFTWIQWVKVTSYPGSVSYICAYGGAATDPGQAFEISINASTGKLSALGGNNGAGGWTVTGPTNTVATGTWEMICLRINSATGVATLSLNDPTVTNNKSTRASTISANSVALALVIGSYKAIGDATFSLNGLTDVVGLWLSAQGAGGCLTDTQVKNAYNAGAGAEYPFTGIP
jgi:hypothetical protein